MNQQDFWLYTEMYENISKSHVLTNHLLKTVNFLPFWIELIPPAKNASSPSDGKRQTSRGVEPTAFNWMVLIKLKVWILEVKTRPWSVCGMARGKDFNIPVKKFSIIRLDWNITRRRLDYSITSAVNWYAVTNNHVEISLCPTPEAFHY